MRSASFEPLRRPRQERTIRQAAQKEAPNRALLSPLLDYHDPCIDAAGRKSKPIHDASRSSRCQQWGQTGVNCVRLVVSLSIRITSTCRGGYGRMQVRHMTREITRFHRARPHSEFGGFGRFSDRCHSVTKSSTATIKRAAQRCASRGNGGELE